MTQRFRASGGLIPLARMRSLAVVIVLTLLGAGDVLAQPATPTAEQAQQAIKAARSLGGDFRQRIHPHTQRVAHVLVLPRSTAEAS